MSLEQWRYDHQLGLLAYAVLTTDAGGPSSARFTSMRRELARRLINEYTAPTRDEWLRGMPITVLRLLHRALSDRIKVGGDLHAVLPDIDRTIAWLTTDADHPYWTRVQIWVYQCLLSATSGRRLLELGRTLFDRSQRPPFVSWRTLAKSPEHAARLDDILRRCRDPWASTVIRRRCIDDLALVLGQTLAWRQIENLLFHSLYVWPLLVIQLEHEPDEIAISLPVAIDIVLDDADRVLGVSQRGAVSIDRWYPHLARSAAVGKKLWRAKHGSSGAFWTHVNAASVEFDFAQAGEHAAVLMQFGYGDVSIDDGSAESYFAQAVLNRLLGRTNVFASAATGPIGEQIEGEPEEDPDLEGATVGPEPVLTLNYKVAPVRSLSAKLQYVFESEAFERVVVPASSAVEIPDGRTTEVVRAVHLHDMADAMQTQGWRQFHYIRCPDVSWAIHSERQGRPGLLPTTHPDVDEITERLRTNTDRPVLRCSNGSTVALFSALHHINARFRREPKPPRGLSWACIRCLEFEQDLRFWHVLWDLAGAPLRSLESLMRHPSRDETVRQVAALMNRFAPTHDNPSQRAPDILVIAGLQTLLNRDTESFDSSARPFMVSDVLESLETVGRLSPVPIEAQRAEIGVTRIVIIERETSDADQERATPSIDFGNAQEVECLRILATLDHGFTHHMAATALGDLAEAFDGNLKDGLLSSWRQRGLLREGQGRYHVPEYVRQAVVDDRLPRSKRAEQHFRAGCALAPYAYDRRVPALALDVAFRPEYVHEASRHLTLAWRHVDTNREAGLASAIGKVLSNVTRFAELPGWGNVRKLLKAKMLPGAAYEAACDLLEWQEEAGIEPHPSHLRHAAQAAVQYARASRGDKSKELHTHLVAAADAWYRQALAVTEHLPHERDANRLSVLTEHAVFLDTIHGTTATREVQRLTREAYALITAGANPLAARGEWGELASDAESDHRRALELLLPLLIERQEWAQLWVKGLGAAMLVNDREAITRIRRALQEKRERDRARGWELKQKVEVQAEKRRNDPRPWVRARWETGLVGLGIRLDAGRPYRNRASRQHT